MKNGGYIVIDDDSLTHSLFYMSSILDSEIYVPDPSHFVHNSLIDSVQPSDFQDVFLAISSTISVFPPTILDPIHFYKLSFVVGTHSQRFLEDFEHLLPSSFHFYYRGFIISIFS